MKARVNFWAKFREAVRQFHHRFACGEKKAASAFLLQNHQTAINQAPLAFMAVAAFTIDDC
jgi:hypothetical protein